MTTYTPITTMERMKRCIRQTKGAIFVQPRLGVSEQWMQITKKQALAICAGVGESTPSQMEMPTGKFGDISENGNIYFG